MKIGKSFKGHFKIKCSYEELRAIYKTFAATSASIDAENGVSPLVAQRIYEITSAAVENDNG